MKKLRPLLDCVWLALAISLHGADPAPGHPATAHLLILHTNDLHDHIRPGYNGRGGLPYISGYVQQVRRERKDVLLLDAGDVTEKGDMVAFKSNYEMTYAALRRIGYDGVTIGNHDYDDVWAAGVHHYEQVLGQPLLCLNLLKADGSPEFAPSRIVEVGGIKVGLIGLIVPRQERCLSFDESGRALAREAERLKREVTLVIAVCHEGARDCAKWSQQAPAVDVFVSGHTHEALAQPVVVPGTGARIVQAGSYANWVGRLDLVVDVNARKILEARGELVPMLHDTVPVDAAMLAWVRAREKELCPEAVEFVLQNPTELDAFAVARLAADAMRRQAGTDIAFCDSYQVLRATLPAGPVDVNAIFLTGGQRGHDTVLTELSGAEIEAYVNGLARFHRERSEWAGFRLGGQSDPGGAQHMATDLAAAKTYSVIMPKLEWDSRFLRLVGRMREKKPGGPLAAREFTAVPTTITFTGALRAYLAGMAAEGGTPEARAKQLATDQVLGAK